MGALSSSDLNLKTESGKREGKIKKEIIISREIEAIALILNMITDNPNSSW